MKDKDLVLHGKVENGTIRLGDKLALMPSGAPAQVLGLLDGQDRKVKFALPGENIQIKINVSDEEAVKRGDVLCQREAKMPVTHVLEVELDILDLLEYKPIISRGYICVMHIHTASDDIIISELIRSEETGEKGELIVKQRPKFARSHTRLICRLESKNPLALEKFEHIQQMGRFTLRDEGRTICVGKVLKYKPLSKWIEGKDSPDVPEAQPVVVTVNEGNHFVYNLETGETRNQAPPLAEISEEAD